MSNRIREVIVSDTRIEPVAAEVRISVFPEQLTHTTDVRGQLVGPRCVYTSTVEVAYPMRTWSLADQPRELPHLSLSVVIPEPSLWDPETPFVYEGPVELWENGQCVDRVTIRHGLRDLRMGHRGIRLNSRAFAVRGIVCHTCSETDAAQLRQAGFNTLFVKDVTKNPDLLVSADRFGFFVLNRLSGPVEAYLPLNPALCGHPSTLGWVLTESTFAQESILMAANLLASFDGQSRLGAELFDVPEEPLPEGVAFLVCERDMVPDLERFHLPLIVRTHVRPDDNDEWQSVLSAPGILGWIWHPSA
jgi:hypothetical protein